MKRLYEKKNGKLIAVKEFDRYRQWKKGHYFVTISENGRGYRLMKNMVEPDHQRLYVALQMFREQLITSLNEASKTQIPQKITPKAKKLYDELMVELGPAKRLYYDSVSDIVDNALDKLNETVKLYNEEKGK